MKKFVRLTAFMLSALSLAFIVSCGDDDGDDGPDPLVGLYSVTSAVVNTAVEIGGTPIIPAGTDITAQLSGAILEAAVQDDGTTPLCDPITNTRIELTEDGQVFYACSNSDAQQPNGTWQINGARDQLNLTFTIQGQSLPLVFVDFVESGNNISGTIQQLLLPAEALGLDPALVGALVTLSDVAVTFTKD